MKHIKILKSQIVTLSLLAMLLTACSERSTKYEALPVVPEQLSPLARQPQKPSICSPTCSSNQIVEQTNMQNSLTELLKQVEPVNDNTTH